jgi:hypothetical protein
MTRNAERPNIAATSRPIARSGHGEPVSATAPAATSTPALPATSFREQTHAERMLMSSPRRRQSRTQAEYVGGERQQAAGAHDLDGGREPAGDLHGHLDEHADPERGHDRALEQRGAGLPEQAAADDVEGASVHDGVVARAECHGHGHRGR